MPGSTPARFSSRSSFRPMFVTIWMCTQEWSLICMRATALTLAACHSAYSWVHIQIVTNIGLKLLRELKRAGVEPGMVTDYSMRHEDAEVVVALGCLTHCLGMAIHRHGHEEMSLFLAADRLPGLLDGLYEEPER